MATIQGAYTKIVTTAIVTPYTINPFDLYGNLLPEMTIEVDSTLSQSIIILPEIATLNNNWNIKINVIALTGLINPVNVNSILGTDTIGSGYIVALNANGENVEVSPISFNNYSANITA